MHLLGPFHSLKEMSDGMQAPTSVKLASVLKWGENCVILHSHHLRQQRFTLKLNSHQLLAITQILIFDQWPK